MHALPILKLWEGLNLKWDWESKVKQASVELHSQSTKNFKRYIQLTTNIKIKEAHRKTWKNKWKSANTNKKLKKNSRSATVEIKGQKHQTAEIISVMKYIGNISRLRWQIKKKTQFESDPAGNATNIIFLKQYVYFWMRISVLYQHKEKVYEKL